jgi:two-component system response regulator PilR (NtrC family)
MSPRLLVVDDEQSLTEFLNLLFEEEGYAVDRANSVTEARQKIPVKTYDVVLCDILMPDGNGLELLKEIRECQPLTVVIMMTAYTSDKSHIEAMKNGAFGYISKPFDIDELKVVVQGALIKKGLEVENAQLRRELGQKYQPPNIIGKSPKMEEVFSLVERVSKTQSTVLISGESGTGKELIARALHFSGTRQGKRFLTINCSAMPEALLESELFGHEKGSFTGAVRDKKGLFQEADGGTLFLDEIGEMTLSMQVKLLRVLQEKRVRRVGGHEEKPVDVRILTATNQNLPELIAAGTFRKDLYYRIHVIPIELPPLRQRRDDIRLLAVHFVGKYSKEMGLEAKLINAEALRLLEGYYWPGNVRELENTIERAMALSTEETLTKEDLPAHLAGDSQMYDVTLPEEGIDLESYLDHIRSQLMEQALARTQRKQTKAAKVLKMSFRSFRYYAKKLELVGADVSADVTADEDVLDETPPT